MHRVGPPHAMFRGKYLAQLRALLPVNTIIPTAGGPSGTACPPVASTTSRTDVSGIDMRAVRSAISPAESVVVPPELEQQFGGGGGGGFA